MKKKQILEILTIIFGSTLLAFTVCNIHSRLSFSEGGQIGIELLLFHWFNISPSISSFVIDFTLYILGFIILGKKFALNALIGTLSYSISYFIFERLNLNIYMVDNLFVMAIIAGILVGVSSGLVVRHYGACGGDDSLALIIRKLTKLPLFMCYFVMDLIIIILSLTYIPFNKVIYSIITAFTSSVVIDIVAKDHLERN